MNIESYLKQNHIGRDNAVKSKDLECLFSITGSELRRIVNDSRANGIPICSCRKGYFYAATNEETSATIRQLESRIKKIKEAKNGLISSNIQEDNTNGKTSIN